MRLCIGVIVCALAVGACSKGEQHAVKVECESPDRSAHGPGWCAARLDEFVGAHPDVEIDDVAIAYEHIGDSDFASLVVLYRGYVARVGDNDGSGSAKK